MHVINPYAGHYVNFLDSARLSGISSASEPGRVHTLFLEFLQERVQILATDWKASRRNKTHIEQFQKATRGLVDQAVTTRLREKMYTLYQVIPRDLQEQLDYIEQYLGVVRYSQLLNLSTHSPLEDLFDPKKITTSWGNPDSERVKKCTIDLLTTWKDQLAEDERKCLYDQEKMSILIQTIEPLFNQYTTNLLREKIIAYFDSFPPELRKVVESLEDQILNILSHPTQVPSELFNTPRSKNGEAYSPTKQHAVNERREELKEELIINRFASYNKIRYKELKKGASFSEVVFYDELLQLTTPAEIQAALSNVKDEQIEALLAQFLKSKKPEEIPLFFKVFGLMPGYVLRALLITLRGNDGWFKYLREILTPKTREFLPHLTKIVATCRQWPAEIRNFLNQQRLLLTSKNVEFQHRKATSRNSSPTSTPTKRTPTSSLSISPYSTPSSSPPSSVASSPTGSVLSSLGGDSPLVQIVVPVFLQEFADMKMHLANSIKAVEILTCLLKGPELFKIAVEEIETVKRECSRLQEELTDEAFLPSLAQPFYAYHLADFGYSDTHDFELFVVLFSPWGLIDDSDFVKAGILAHTEIPQSNKARPNEPVPSFLPIIKQKFEAAGLVTLGDFKFHGIVTREHLTSYFNFQILKSWNLLKAKDYVQIGLFEATDFPDQNALVPHYRLVGKLFDFGITCADALVNLKIRSQAELKTYLDKQKASLRK